MSEKDFEKVEERPEINRVPRTHSEEALLLRTQPDGWEYPLFAAVLRRKSDELESKWREHEARYRRPSETTLSEPEALDRMSGVFDEAAVIVDNMMLHFTPVSQERTFGKLGESGDPRRITEFAEGIVAAYSELLDWSARLRATGVPERFRGIFDIASEYADLPLRQLREYIDRVVDELDGLPAALREGRPITAVLTLTLSVDDEVGERFTRELEREVRAQERAVLPTSRAVDQAGRAYERAQAWEEKERKRLYVEARQAEVEAMNEETVAEIAALESLLGATLNVHDYLDINSLKEEPEIPPFQPGTLASPEPTPEIVRFMPPTLSGMAKLVPGAKAKHEKAVEGARAAYASEGAAHARREQKREAALGAAYSDYEAKVEKIKARARAQNREVDLFRERFEGGDPAAIVEYFLLVLDASSYPEGFPKQHKIAYVPESKQLVVEYELPRLDGSVPTDKQYRYVKARDAIEHTTRPAAQVKALYGSIVAQITLRTLHELFEADRSTKLDTVVFNGYVNTIDPATGKPVSPHLVTVRASRDAFLQLDLRNVEPLACLKGLNASV
jgi:hypothetical protein